MEGNTRSSLMLSHTHICTLNIMHFTNLCEGGSVYGGVFLLMAPAVIAISVQEILGHHSFWTTYPTILLTTQQITDVF